MSDANTLLDQLGFARAFALGQPDWSVVPDTPGVYVIFEGTEIIYIGMAGRDQKGSLRRRLRDHASGQIVNMFAQYLLFARILKGSDPPRTPREATIRCRTWIRSYCSVRVLPITDKVEARRVEGELRANLKPAFNGIPVAAADQTMTA
jgi:hypothetical protein